MILNMANVATEFLTKVCFQQLVKLSLNPIISVALKQVDWNFVTLKLVNVQVIVHGGLIKGWKTVKLLIKY